MHAALSATVHMDGGGLGGRSTMRLPDRPDSFDEVRTLDGNFFGGLSCELQCGDARYGLVVGHVYSCSRRDFPHAASFAASALVFSPAVQGCGNVLSMLRT